jgi:ribosomal protein L13E
MKISQEANERNLKAISEMQERWKQISEVILAALAKPATPPTSTFNNGSYKTGDGEKLQPIRPGGLDHKKWSSKGLLSDVPNNVE